MVGVDEDYLLLALRLGRHVEGLVDWYFGPASLASRVEAEPLADPARLADEGAALCDRIATEAAGGRWLAEQARGLHTYARVLAGEPLSYADEVEGCYGVRPSLVAEDVLERAHARIDELLGGSGDLAERHIAWRTRQSVTGEALAELIDSVLPAVRAATRHIVDLPDGEQIDIGYVRDEPWAAFNYYQGDLRSRVVVNTDLPMVWTRALEIVAHEAYPGHHAERSVKEALLVRGQGLLAETIGPVPTPQAVVSEGIARLAQAHALTDEVLGVALPVLARHGLVVDVEQALALVEPIAALEHATANVALLLHEHGLPEDEAVAYLVRLGLRGEDYARQQVRFVTDPTWRAYVSTYTQGARLCGAFVAARPADGFRRLLTEQIAASDLVALAG